MRSRDRTLILVLAACSALAQMATNLVLPALPEIRSHFHASIAAVQSMLSVYMIAFACGILVVGPLSDRWGRRPVIIGSLVVFACGSLIAAGAPSLPVLVLGRVVQALGASAGIIVSRAVFGDLFEGAELARRIAALTTVAVAATTAAPYLGGLVSEATNWRGPFWVLAAAPLLLAVVCSRLLPETRTREHTSLPLSALLRSSRSVLAQPAFFRYVLQSGAIFAIFMVIVANTPYILSGVLGLSATQFGLYYMLIAFGYILGNMHVSRGAHTQSIERTTALGLWLQLAGALLALAFAAGGLDHPLWLFGPMVPLAFGQGLAMPHLMARAVALAPGFAGVATSLLGFAQQAMGALSVQAMGWAPTNSAVPVMLFCSAASVAALLPVLRSHLAERSVARL